MSSSSGEPSNKGIDASVGALVWVRRRNGSWWPGRIVGMDELSEGCLVSPKSGTPVKLLGREDASIDWYNLEKSKRVKNFRCGEYDACIEKAKVAAASSNKKAVKYARREDAILHALEIESALLDKDHPDFYSRTDTSSVFKQDILDQESPKASHSGKEVDDTSHGVIEFDGDSLSAPDLSYSGTSFEEPNHARYPKLQTEQGTRGKTPNDSEDDGMEGSKRMRGLQDIGMGVVSDKKIIESIQQDNGSLHDANAVNCMVNGGAMNGGKGSPPLKRKRSQVAYVNEHPKKRNRRRSVSKVLESSTMVSVAVTCEQFASSFGSPLGGASESKITKRSLANNSESTGLSYENGVAVNDEDRPSNNRHVHDKMKKEPSLLGPPAIELYDVPLNAEDKNCAVYTNGSFGRTQFGILGRQSSQSSQAEEALQPEGINEYGFTESAAAAACYGSTSERMERSTSKWQLKGKRNSRHQNKRKRWIHLQNENGIEVEPSLLCSQSVLESEDQVNGIWDRTKESMTPESQRPLPPRQSRFTLHPRYQTAEYPLGSDSTLYDVELKVNAKSSRGSSDVPLVSLMSKLNGKAIVGHPLTVEALHDGYYNDLEKKLPPSVPRSHSPASAKSKKNGLMSKKMRKLSSLTGGQRTGEEGIGKPLVEKQRSPVVACIPLKLVFSRLNEALNRPPNHHLSASIHT